LCGKKYVGLSAVPPPPPDFDSNWILPPYFTFFRILPLIKFKYKILNKFLEKFEKKLIKYHKMQKKILKKKNEL